MNINEFIKMTAGGVKIAEFTEIRATIIARYKEVYGSDIDLSTATADGVFVNDISLMINNILQSIRTLYNNLDVRTASGIYLDSLCNLSNVTRKPATHSTTSLQVKNVGTTNVTIDKNTEFVDQSGTIWNYVGANNDIKIAPNETVEVQVACEVAGRVYAPIGWINNTVIASNLVVTQLSEALVGSNTESDSELRSRRLQSSGSTGVTVLESMAGALLNISGIEDVKIYNNSSSSDITSDDGSTIDSHSIYVIVRRNPVVTIEDSTIGRIIFEKLTPGIHSCEMADAVTSGTNKSYEYTISINNIDMGDESKQMVYWKEAESIAPTITITVTPKTHFTTDEFTSIANNLMEYINEKPISENLDSTDIIIQTTFADPKFMSNSTYSVKSVEFEDSNNPDTYYYYNTFAYEKSGTDYKLILSYMEN